MREIKFRAWDTFRKIMVDWDTIIKANPSLSDMKSNCYEWLQFTGLLDKNGKEIFEGDIVRANWGRGELIAEIMFEDGGFVIALREDSYRDMAGEDNNKFYEVIGNIYENPELLKGEAK